MGNIWSSSSTATSATPGGGELRQDGSSAIVAGAVEGSHELKIEGYSRTKGVGRNMGIRSSTFQAAGHRWFIEYYPDGESSSKDDEDASAWVSFYLFLDEKSSGAGYVASVRFTLLDEIGEPVQMDAMGSHSGRCADERHRFEGPDGGYGCRKFIRQTTLEESVHLKHDCFRVRCDIVVFDKYRAEDTTAARPAAAAPPPDMHRDIGSLLSSGAHADVTFEVAGETFRAHRLVLGARSPVFMAELLGPAAKETNVVRVDDMEARVFRAMLHFIYNDGALPEATEGHADKLVMAQRLLVAADRYGLERLKLMCEDKLCAYVDVGTAATTLALAEQHGCRRLKEACLKFHESPGNLRKILGSDGFKHLASSCPSLLKELLAKFAP